MIIASAKSLSLLELANPCKDDLASNDNSYIIFKTMLFLADR